MRAAEILQTAQNDMLVQPELNQEQNETLQRLWQLSKEATLERIRCTKQLRELEEKENVAINELRKFLGTHLTPRTQ